MSCHHSHHSLDTKNAITVSLSVVDSQHVLLREESQEQRKLREVFSPSSCICTRAIAVRRITAEEHPCRGELGVFATERILGGSRIVQYTGVAKRPQAKQDTCAYTFTLKAGNLSIDASRVC